jgi:hypothetical protein
VTVAVSLGEMFFFIVEQTEFGQAIRKIGCNEPRSGLPDIENDEIR